MSTRKASTSGTSGRPNGDPAGRPQRPVQRWLVTDAWEPSLLRKLQQAEPRLKQQRNS